jgi:hypothetical protein
MIYMERRNDASESLTWSQCDLDEWGEILVKADDIKSDSNKYDAVIRNMKHKASKINRIADIRQKLSEDKGPNYKEDSGRNY